MLIKVGMVLREETSDSIVMSLSGKSQLVNPHVEYLVVDHFSEETGGLAYSHCWNVTTKRYEKRRNVLLRCFIEHGGIEVVTDPAIIAKVTKDYKPSPERLAYEARHTSKKKGKVRL